MLKEPDIALTTVLLTTKKQLLDLLAYICTIISTKQDESALEFTQLQIALDKTHEYVDLIHLQPSDKTPWRDLLMMMHVLDHMQRVHERCSEGIHLIEHIHDVEELKRPTGALVTAIAKMSEALQSGHYDIAYKVAETNRQEFAALADPIRQSIMTNIASGKISVPDGNYQLDALKWLQRIGNHLWRITYHLNNAR
jgi:phosphate:Na+ symporter